MDRLRRGDTRAGLARAHAHLVGAGARGMTGLAQILVEHGLRVTASDPAHGPAVDRLRRLGARVDVGHRVGRGPRRAQLLVYGPDTDPGHGDRLAAARRGAVQGPPSRWLGPLMRKGVGLVVAGRRGAGVASAMIGWTLHRAGLDPTVVLGTAAPQLGGWARLGSGPHRVIEAVEERDGLGPEAPRVAVLLDVGHRRGVDPAARVAVVRRFAASVPHDGLILAGGPDELVGDAVRDVETAVEWLSLRRGGTWWGGHLSEERGRYRFRAFHRGRFAVEVRLRVPGLRNVTSALAAVAACYRLDVPTCDIKEALEEFGGLSRDFESRGSYRGVTLVDDEGGDPSAVSETLAIGRQMFGARRLWTVLQPDPSDWTPDDPGRLAVAFAAADRVLILGDGPSGPRPGGAESLTGALVATGIRARRLATLDDVLLELDRNLEPGDVLLTLGAGDVGKIADAFIRRLSRDRQGR